jgi:ferredoxin
MNMDIKEIYEKFDQIGCLTFATIDEGYPETRIAHLFAYDEEGLYFRTMTVKPFYRQITENGKMSICGMSASPHVVHSEATGLPIFEPGFTMKATGDVREIPFEELLKKEHKSQGFVMGIKDIRRYPDLRAFVMDRFRGEYYDYDFDLVTRDHKIVRESFSFNDFPTKFRGMKINDKCIGCNQCKEQCDAKLFKAIEIDESGGYFINNNHCDVCGDCTLVCPVGAIDRYSM